MRRVAVENKAQEINKTEAEEKEDSKKEETLKKMRDLQKKIIFFNVSQLYTIKFGIIT